MKVSESNELRKQIRARYAWPGGYPMYLVMADGGSLCIDCARKGYRNIYHSLKNDIRDGWKPEGIDVNWEQTDLFCDHCNKQIESAYGEVESK